MTAPLVIRRHPDGTRYVQPYLGTNRVTGKRIRPYKRFPAGLTDEEVAEQAAAWLAEVAPAVAEGYGMRLSDQLSRYVDWLEGSGRASANTVRAYRSYVRNYLGGLADADPREVTTPMVSALYRRLLACGGASGRPVSPNTVVPFHWFLVGGFRWLVGEGICDSNPAAEATRPRVRRGEAVSVDGADLPALSAALAGALREADGTPAGVRRRNYALAAWLALHTGLRCGEACGLRRRDVDLPRALVRVRGTVVAARGGPERQGFTKGRRPRTVALARDDADELARHLAWQETYLPSWGPSTPVVTTDGGWCRPDRVSREFSRMAREVGLPPGTTFHSLRHTHGTWLLMQGVDPKTVSERLGHASVATTLSIYAHVLPGRDAQAAEEFSRLAREAEETP